MRLFDRKTDHRDADAAAPLDPVALTLAIWLGLMCCVAGLVRLAEQAKANAAAAHGVSAMPTVAMQLTPYG